MSVQTRKLQRMFESDSSIMLESLTRMLAGIEPGVLDDTDLDRAFRAAHSIKSEAGFLSITSVADAAHALEDTLAEVRRAGGTVTDSSATQLRRGLKMLRSSLQTRPGFDDGTRSGTSAGDRRADPPGGGYAAGAGADSGANEAQRGEPSTTRSRPDLNRRAEQGMLRDARRRGERLFRLTVSLKSAAEMRYARAFLVVNNLELSSAVIRTDPELDSLRESPAERVTIVVTSPGEEDAIRRAVHVDEVELTELVELSFDEPLVGEDGGRAAAPGGASTSALQGGDENNEELSLLADEIVAAADEAAKSIERDMSSSPGAAAPERTNEAGRALRRVRSYADALRERLGRSARVQLLDLFRELTATSVRYAAGQGKRVRLVVGGDGAAVPPAVGDTLLESVLHLIRNSIDHGVETIDERAKRGQHPAATIKVRVDRIGSQVRVVVQDNGTGIDEAAVRTRAGDQDSPLLDVLARSGFSMREAADTNAGRGVGLDSVLHSVRTLLGGGIRLVNTPRKGMTFVITVPAETRLVHVIVVESGTSAYAVPSATLVRHEPLERRRIRRDSFGSHYYEYEGETITLTTVSGRSIVVKSLSERSVVLVVRAGLRRRAVAVDGVLGEEAVVRESASVRRVYSRVLGREIPFVFPASLEERGDSDR